MDSTGRCLLRIKEGMNDLSPKEQQVAAYILAHAEEAANLQLTELARRFGTSVSTVLRLCKSLHFSGYKDFSRSLYSDVHTARPETAFDDIHPGDDPVTVMNNIYTGSISALKNTVAIMNPEELEKAVSALCAARRIDFYGAGTSGLVAMDAGNKFSRVNKTTIATIDPHNQILTALTLSPEDMAVLVSYSGETADIINVAHAIKSIGATIISITRFGRSPVADLADIHLYTASTETLLRSGAMSSRLAQMFVVDILYASVCSRIFDEVKPHLEKTRQATLKFHTTDDRRG